MKRWRLRIAVVFALCCAIAPLCYAACIPDSTKHTPERPIPPESVGGVSVPFDVPVWPTILKTEFHVLPWISFGTASITIPGTGKCIDIPSPCLSLKAIPVWIPWLRPLDAECNDPAVCPGK